jgi:4-carboxymuconolactone decarboxylase
MTQQPLAGAEELTKLDPVFAQMAVQAGRNLWDLPHLSTFEKAILCITADLCHPHLDTPLAMHVQMALAGGVEPRAVRELLRHLGPYVGYPVLVPAFQRLAELGVPAETDPVPVMEAPLPSELARYSEDLPVAGLAEFTRAQFAQRWARPGLSMRERAIACLAVDVHYQTLGESFALHVGLARAAGLEDATFHVILQGIAEFGLARAWNAARALTELIEAEKQAESVDSLAIRELIDHSMVLVDARDYEGYGALYTVDGRYESPFARATGRDGISAMSRNLTESGFTEGMRHFTGPISVRVHGTEADAVSYFWVAQVKDSPTIYATGTFTDRLVKQDGTWRFAHRLQEGDPNGRDNT